MIIPFFERLAPSKSVVLLGCGGGYDIVGAVPLMTWLLGQGKRVTLANVSFTDRASIEDWSGDVQDQVGPLGWAVRLGTDPVFDYAEEELAYWLRERGIRDVGMYAVGRGGVIPLAETIRAIVGRAGADALVLVDGGTDSLLKGDEADLATVDEDAASIVAADLVDLPTKLLACIGFGIDTFHGICHHSFLENVAEAIRLGGHLGCVSVTRESAEGRAYLDAVDFLAANHSVDSIVQGSIAGAIQGSFGNVHATSRTAGHELFVNPLMSTYWTFGYAKRSLDEPWRPGPPLALRLRDGHAQASLAVPPPVPRGTKVRPLLEGPARATA